MDYKLDYITRLFQRINRKKIEHYVITRIWHLLNDYDIKLTPQQYVSRGSLKYALTDIYFPQFGYHVEINEPAHYESEERIQNDKKRIRDIESVTGHKVFIIDCRLNLDDIHKQIDLLISEIKVCHSKQLGNGTFTPWRPENEHNPNYWKAKGKLSSSDEVLLNTIEDICLLFNIDPKLTKRGFLRKGGIQNPNNQDQFLWWPSENSRSGWLNAFDDFNGTITESHKDNIKKNDHYNFHSKFKQQRIVFFHYKDHLGRKNYKFIGIFENDLNMSSPIEGMVWKRISKEICLNTH